MPAKFVGQVVARWLKEPGPDRTMELTEPFGYEQANGTKWDVPKGEQVDGASIPQWAWTIFGSPYTGDYRRASVVHDYYCRVRTRSSDDTHLMFAEAALTDGVAKDMAGILYLAVKTGGGSWSAPSPSIAKGKPARAAIESITVIPEEDFADITAWIQKTKPGFAQIDKRIARDGVQLAVPPKSKLQNAAGAFR